MPFVQYDTGVTHVTVSIAVADAAELDAALRRAAAASEGGARLVEWRVDELALHSVAAEAIGRLVADSPMPSIVTIRSATEAGLYDGDEAHRAELLAGLIRSDTPPRYIDVEWRMFRRPGALREKLTTAIDGARADRQPSLIASAHDFAGRPADLLQVVEQAALDAHVDVIKLAWTARSLRDNLEAFDLLAERRKPMIALCMGPFGLMSRVLSPKFGGLLTYASDSDAAATAPGQPTLVQLRDMYRFESIGKFTKVYGVIGWPVEHSQSPRVHNEGFSAIGFDGVYLPLPVPSEYEHFKATVGELIDHDRLGLGGASVTIPHKRHLVRFVEERGGRMDDMSRRIGAANTLIVGSAGGLECANTDAPAVVQSLLEAMNAGVDALQEKRAAVLGAGGAARAAVAALMDAGAEVVVFNRTADRALQLVDDLMTPRNQDDAGRARVGDTAALRDERFDIYVNCTSIGMATGPEPNASPLDVLAGSAVTLDESAVVLDTVYAPRRTALVQQAETAGATVIEGWDMFLRQAAMQFRMWTGRELPNVSN